MAYRVAWPVWTRARAISRDHQPDMWLLAIPKLRKRWPLDVNASMLSSYCLPPTDVLTLRALNSPSKGPRPSKVRYIFHCSTYRNITIVTAHLHTDTFKQRVKVNQSQRFRFSNKFPYFHMKRRFRTE